MSYTIQLPEEEEKRGKYTVILPEAQAEPDQGFASVEDQLMRMKRGLGLGVRSVVQAPAKAAGMFVDPFVQAAGGRPTADRVSEQLTRWGVPQPETDNEKLAGAISEATLGGGAAVRGAQAVASGTQAVSPLIQQIATRPFGELFANAAGAGASESARQAGLPGWAQIAAGVVAPMAATGTVAAAQAAGRGAREAFRPLTQTGANQIAADTLGRLTQDKQRAIRNLEASIANRDTTGAVPGYTKTAGAASKDAGIIGAEQVRTGDAAFAPDFMPVFGKNNAALTADLRRLRADSEKLARWKDVRAKVTDEMRESAFDKAKAPVNLSPVADRIMKIAGTPEGGREESRKAINWLVDRVKLYADEGRVDARNAYELEKDIGALVAGKINSDKGPIRLSAGLANDVRKELVDQISAVAPGFDKYLKTYSDLSKSIDRLEIITKNLGDRSLKKVTNAKQSLDNTGPLTTTQRTVSQNAVENAIPKIQAELTKRKLPGLTDYQQRILSRVDNTLNEQTAAATGGKPPGSDTFRNLSGSNLFDSILGAEAAGSLVPQWITKPVGLLYGKTVEPRIQDIITNAFLDDRKMAELLKIARKTRRTPTMQELATNAGQNVYGGLLGTAFTE